MVDYVAENVIIGVGKLEVDGSSLGYTSGGVILQKTGERMEKEVDQSYAAVGIHKIKETFELRTNLAEATLANLKIAWEQIETVDVAGDKRTLSLGMNPDVVEHSLKFYGKSPEGFDREYLVFKAIIWETGELVHQKDGLSVIPVTFRILPDITKGTGLEYGHVEDTIS